MSDPLVVAHRGASADRPEHTLAAYELALKEGADGLECDVRLTSDGHLVCVHDRKIDRISTGTGRVSTHTLESLNKYEFGIWKDQQARAEIESRYGDPSEVLTLAALLELTLDWGGPTKLFIETKHPVRYGGLVENKLLAELHRFGLARPPSADHARAVVMSFSPAAVWRVRRSAPLLPTVLLGDASRYLGGGAATTIGATTIVGATAIGPSVKSLRERPRLVDAAAAAGRATYTWTVDDYDDVMYCRDLGVRWIATNHPGRTKQWLSEAH